VRLAVVTLLVLILSPGGVACGAPEWEGRPTEHWTRQLAEEDVRARWYAAYALGQIGPEARAAVEPLMKILENPREHEYVRGNAAWALGRIGPGAEAAVPLLVETLSSRHLSVRRNAPLALGRMGSAAKDAAPRLRELLSDQDPTVVVHSALALWQIEEDERAVQGLVALTRQQREDLRPYLAVSALGEIGTARNEVLPALTAALGHKDPDVRRAAARELGRIGPEALPSLQEVLRAGHSGRPSAVEALGRIGVDALPALTEALRSDDAASRRAAARALGRLGPAAKEAAPALIAALGDRDPAVRETIGWARGEIRGE
jgi:HEAT repeat protein